TDGQPLITGQQNLSTNITSVRDVSNGPAFYATNEWGNGVSAIAYPPYAIGVYGIHQATNGVVGAPGVRGDNNSTYPTANGVEGYALSPTGSGVYGQNNGGGYGVLGKAPDGTGVYGIHQAATGNGPGVRGETFSPGGYGVIGVNN